MSAIDNDAVAPQFKSLNFALCYNTRAHCATRLARLLAPVLSKPFAIIIFARVHNISRERECLTARIAYTNALHQVSPPNYRILMDLVNT